MVRQIRKKETKKKEEINKITTRQQTGKTRNEKENKCTRDVLRWRPGRRTPGGVGPNREASWFLN